MTINNSNNNNNKNKINNNNCSCSSNNSDHQEIQIKRKRDECKHFQEYKESLDKDDFYHTITTIIQYLSISKSGLLDTTQMPLPSCVECHSYNGRIHLCLQCVYAGCWKQQHIIEHLKQSNHYLAMDSSQYQIYCYHCKDYIYDTQYTELLENIVESRIKSIQNLTYYKEEGAEYHSWKPSNEEISKIQNTSNQTEATNMLGLRGLNNLGNTCFMNVILQSFIHNPILRNYFLSDLHSSNSCEKKRENIIKQQQQQQQQISIENSDGETSTNGNSNSNSNNGNGSSTNNSICLGCEMDILYNQIFSGVKNPYTPHHFLYSCWNYSNYLASYEQQDAHEFLISSLNGIHTHCGGTHGKDCNCIVHLTFGGLLKSEVKCTNCSFTSSTTDPFTDISLDIPKSHHHHHHHHHHKDKDNSNGNHNENQIDHNESNNSLQACLERFTQPEKLDEKYFCRKCNSKQESTKQLTFNTLPVVLCFHLKRFEQSKTHRRTHKIDTFIEFPPVLDMSPYTSTDTKKMNKNNEKDNNDDKECIENETSKVIPNDNYIYELFAVVNHTGKMDGGHYTCFVVHNGRWYKCDDSMITFSSIQNVIQSKGYLLFYIKRELRYKKMSSPTIKIES